MKKAIFILLISFLLCGLFYSQVKAAEMLEIDGKVYVLEEGETEWTKAFKGKVLNEGDKVKTKGRSSAVISFDEEKKNVIEVDSNSEVGFEELEPTVIEMPKGIIMSKISDLEKGSTFEIRTPTAIAGVAGTGWRTIYNPRNKKFEAHVYENTVIVYTPQNSAKNQRGVAYAAVQGGYQQHPVNAGSKGIFYNGDYKEKELSNRDLKKWCEFLRKLKKLGLPVILCPEPGEETEKKVDEKLQEKQERSIDKMIDREDMEDRIEKEDRLPRQRRGFTVGP